jgi:uncharacterized membrane protein
MANKTKKQKSVQETKGSQGHQFTLVFGKQNYMLMIIGMVLIVLGFVLMYGGKEDIYSFRKITLAPILVVAGFVVEVIAILRKPASQENGTH